MGTCGVGNHPIHLWPLLIVGSVLHDDSLCGEEDYTINCGDGYGAGHGGINGNGYGNGDDYGDASVAGGGWGDTHYGDGWGDGDGSGEGW
jgi:hypothetical protein